MTETYEKFYEQYHSKGSQKAQGYDKSHFDGMTDEEKEKAFQLLKNELVAPGVAEWLYYLNKNKALKVMEEFVSRSLVEPTSGIHRIVYQLYLVTKDKRFQDSLIDGYNKYYSWEKDEAIWLVNRSKPEKDKEISFYKKIILSETDPEPLSTAANFYLRAKGLPMATEEDKSKFYSFRKMLESENKDIKAKGFILLDEEVS